MAFMFSMVFWACSIGSRLNAAFAERYFMERHFELRDALC